MRKKLLLFLHFVLIAQLYSMELICAPNAEVIEQNANLGKSVVEELQNKMKMQSNTRHLIVPSATDYITAAYNINQQINWAKNHSCLYLLQIKLTDTQLKANLMDLKSGEYVFENAYNIKSPNNLSPILEQLGKTLQHPEFIESETIKKETANTERKSINKEKDFASEQEIVVQEQVKDEDKKKERKYRVRFAYNFYHISDLEEGYSVKSGLVFKFPIIDNVIFEPELSIVARYLTTNEEINYSNGYTNYYNSKIMECAISFPMMFKILSIENKVGNKIYIEGGTKIEVPFGTSIDGKTYDSRAVVDLGLIFGIGVNFGKSFSIGIRVIKGLTDFDNANGREKPVQYEIGLSF